MDKSDVGLRVSEQLIRISEIRGSSGRAASRSIKHPRKLPVGIISQFSYDQRVLANPHEQQRVGGELHDFVGVHEIARREVLGLAQGTFGVFDQHILFTPPFGFVGDGFAAHRFR